MKPCGSGDARRWHGSGRATPFRKPILDRWKVLTEVHADIRLPVMDIPAEELRQAP
jgi:hypothetical protein